MIRPSEIVSWRLAFLGKKLCGPLDCTKEAKLCVSTEVVWKPDKDIPDAGIQSAYKPLGIDRLSPLESSIDA